ncbi:hypothetical protein FOZ61_006713 [Perkinsus olseni]|uniref:Protein kinase domain-containing protein n=1 Tax=Perkinsus olseni TaxID=32597 RepID=A0A7J6LBX1_PEROL|nr:hypothetical protein FOZ61_006713 [Perkinsus olseni]KAF4660472.1 hypothetical protein FOL46_006106 [Perkinsus olseni]
MQFTESITTVGTPLAQYILGDTIGEGTFGKVKLGKHIATGEQVAVKILEKGKIITPADFERVSREIRILQSLRRSPHVIQLFEIMETPWEVFMVMEYASGGELFDYIVDNGKVSESEACKFIRQIISGACSLHRANVVHRDLKPENLLLDRDGNIRIADFGLSNFFQPGQALRTACGSPCYAPPEMVAGLPYDPPKCDVWSVGVILYAMICGQLPFEDQRTPTLYKKILNGAFKAPNRSKTSREVRRLISRMLTPDPNERPTFEELRRTDSFLRGLFASPIVDPASSKLLLPPGTPIDQCGVRGCRLCEFAQRHGARVNPWKGDFEIDECLLSELDSLGFPRDSTVDGLMAGRRNHATTA